MDGEEAIITMVIIIIMDGMADLLPTQLKKSKHRKEKSKIMKFFKFMKLPKERPAELVLLPLGAVGLLEKGVEEEEDLL